MQITQNTIIDHNGRAVELASRPEYGDSFRVVSIDGTKLTWIAYISKSELSDPRTIHPDRTGAARYQK
jgi:hypothetical protein